MKRKKKYAIIGDEYMKIVENELACGLRCSLSKCRRRSVDERNSIGKRAAGGDYEIRN